MNNSDKLDSDLVFYYKERANEYEKIYDKPERQADLQLARQILRDSFVNKAVIEIACGTGYWTQELARTARSILATDINDTVLDVAKSKKYASATVTFQQANLFELPATGTAESLFGGFIWSHIKIQDLAQFISAANRLVNNDGTLVFMDNRYVEGSSSPISETDNLGNTYQTRKLADGTAYNVLKNFPTESFIRTVLTGKATDIRITNLSYYWILKYRVNKA